MNLGHYSVHCQMLAWIQMRCEVLGGSDYIRQIYKLVLMVFQGWRGQILIGLAVQDVFIKGLLLLTSHLRRSFHILLLHVPVHSFDVLHQFWRDGLVALAASKHSEYVVTVPFLVFFIYFLLLEKIEEGHVVLLLDDQLDG